MSTTNRVKVENWYAQPIHCPFCGEPLEPTEEVSCKHLLYVIAAGNFLERGPRFDEQLTQLIGQSQGWPEFYIEDKKNIGKPYEVANRIREALQPSIEFEIIGPTDSSFIGYAALEEELCGWGKDHQSPYLK